MSNSNWNKQNDDTGLLEREPGLTRSLSLLTLMFALSALILFVLNVPAATRYVDLNNSSPTPPYVDWATAATNIQDAIDAAVDGDLVLVTNGVYSTGGRTNGDSYLTNRVVVSKPLTLQSVNGPSVTSIEGYQVPGTTNSDGAIRCVLLGYGASLTGFTLTNGATLAPGGAIVTSDQDVIGGGILCLSTNEVVSNCVLIANSAYSGGAGVYSGTLNNCALSNNIPSPYGQHGAGAHLSVMNDCIVSGSRSGSAGGVNSVVMNNCLVVSNWYFGARKSTLNNCTLIGNSGGAADSCTLVNCVIQGNFATASMACGGASLSTLRDCQVINNSGTYGGGIKDSTATNCLISGNRATQYGGGAYNSTLNNCLIMGNTSKDGGGVHISRLTNCVITGNSATQYGGGAAAGMLFNCTISGNTAKDGGGGWGGDLTFNNCVITGNWATNNGGGVAQGPSGPILVNCLVKGNSATNNGGGVAGCTLYNVTAVNNAAGGQGGGAYQSTLRNSILYFNSATTFPNTSSAGFNCCTIPTVPGSGNFTNAPRFVDQLAGNFRLQTNSPCIGTGNNGYSSIGIDLDGRPRIVGGTVDVGAYEFQGAGVGELTAWLQGYGLATDGSADFSDTDTDGMNNYGEWRSDTNPTNALSVLRMVSATNSPTGADVTWQSVSTCNYWLERATNLGVASPFESIVTNIVGAAGTKTYTDTSATNGGPYFYRVGVQ